MTPDDLLYQIPQISDTFEHVIIDGPAGLSEVTRTILLITDKAFLPCGASAMDLRASYEAVHVLREVQCLRQGSPDAMLIPNGLHRRRRLSKEFHDTAKNFDIPTSRSPRFLEAYADAVGQGNVVWWMGPRCVEAATEIQELFMEIFSNVINSQAAA